MSEKLKEGATSASRYLGNALSEAERSEHAPLRDVETYQQMKEKAGEKVSFAGVVYINQARERGSLLALVAEEVTRARPVLVKTPDETSALPPAAHVRVWGRMAGEPFANAG